ncbi:MAG: Ig-like domain-containing protein [Candidatus Shapirobacteria bacterium]
MKSNKLLLGFVLGVMGIVFIGFMAIKVLPNVFVTLTKAAPATKVSLGDSYLIGGRILAKADGVDKCVVNVFVLDGTGKGVKGTSVTLSGMEGDEMQSISGDDGKTVFEVTSAKEGQFVLTASIGGVPLDKTSKVTFRN